MSLPNILANEMLVPELLQGNATPEKLSAAVENALTNKTHRSYQMQKFSQIHQLLNLNASEKATQAITELLEDRQKL